MSASVPLIALAPTKVVHLPPSVRRRDDNCDDELVDIMAPLLCY
jgi:hypothetical protein